MADVMKRQWFYIAAVCFVFAAVARDWSGAASFLAAMLVMMDKDES